MIEGTGVSASGRNAVETYEITENISL